MTVSRMFVSTVVALALSVTPALAQHSRSGGAHGPARAAAPAHRAVAPQAYHAAPRQAYPVVGHAIPRPIGYTIRNPYFHTPWYTFRPHLFIGYGVWLGYPLALPYAYNCYNGHFSCDGWYDVYGWPVNTEPVIDKSTTGGVAFDIQPITAAVFIDNVYVGTVADFNTQQLPLLLQAGHKHIDVRAQGFQRISLDITIIAGQVIPYQGNMSPIR